MPNNELHINRQELINLKRDYTNAVEAKKEIFIFQGKELLTTYAKYLIEYLEGRFGIKKSN